MSNVKLIGSVNLAKLKNVGIMGVTGKSGVKKKCIVIPIEDNDIFIKVSTKTRQDGQQYESRIYGLGVECYEKMNVDQFGNSHYLKRSVSKEYVNSHSPEEVEAMNKTYLGDLKPVEIPSSNQAASIQPETVTAAADDDDLPFDLRPVEHIRWANKNKLIWNTRNVLNVVESCPSRIFIRQKICVAAA